MAADLMNQRPLVGADLVDQQDVMLAARRLFTPFQHLELRQRRHVLDSNPLVEPRSKTRASVARCATAPY
jgi:hypothetical protein